MKRPALFLSILFIAILCSTALVSTAISGICRSFYKNDTEKSINVKATPVNKELNDDPMTFGFKQASVKL
jgi:hypothetical protein